MSCDYRIQGEATVRDIPKVMDAINQLASDVRGKDYLTIMQVDASSLDFVRSPRPSGAAAARPDGLAYV
jgi:hypothetical protein